jgi:HK97 family phage prohead protease
MKRELRFINDAEVRLAGDDKKRVITGYAAVFNKPTQIGSRFQEVIRPGAFDRMLKEKQDVRALFNHDDNQVLGRSKSGTLRLSVDSKGLKYEIDPPDTSVGRDTVTVIRSRRRIDGSSFTFIARGQKWNETTKDGVTTYLREITDCDVMDVSPVTYPAYESTSVSVRTMFPDGDIDIPVRTEDPLEQKTSNDDFKERMELSLRIAEKF